MLVQYYIFAAALQSVFPQTELGTFMALDKLDKEKQLRELTNIVTGIRLFNRDCGKGGEGIDDCKLYLLLICYLTKEKVTNHSVVDPSGDHIAI